MSILDSIQQELRDVHRKIAVLEADNTTLKLALSNLVTRIETLEKNASSSSSRSLKLPRVVKSKPGASNGSLTSRTTRGSNNSPSNGGSLTSRLTNNNNKKSSQATTTKKKTGSKRLVLDNAPKNSNGDNEDDDDDDVVDASGNRKVSYYVGKSKVYVYVPKWYHGDPRREAEPPTADLQLDFIYGYNGRYARHNLFYTDKNQQYPRLVYCTAGVGVYFDPVQQAQSFFTGHNNDISALAVHPSQPLVATGQLDPVGAGKPYVCIWDYTTMQLLQKIDGFHDRAIAAIAFSGGEGEYLASVGRDDNNVVAIWRWRGDVSKPLVSANTGKDSIHAILINQYEHTELMFATCGQKLLKLWHMDLKKCTLTHKTCSSFEQTKVQQKNYYAGLFLPKGWLIAGGTSGDVYAFNTTGQFVMAAAEHHSKSVGALCAVGPKGLASAGNDGLIRVYDDELKCVSVINLNEVEDGLKPRSLDYSPANGGTLLVGSSNNTILEVPIAGGLPHTRMQGHFGEVWALAVHPNRAVICTGGHDKALRCWDYRTKTPMTGKVLALKSSVHSASFSPDGRFIACGLVNGKVVIVNYDTFEVVYEKKHRQEQIDALNFSPNGQLIALGSWDQIVELIDMESHSSVALKGHTSSVTHLTFSIDSKYLCTNSRDYEILYWDCETASRVDASVCADVHWFDWQNVLGWPVKSIFSKGMDGTDINALNVSGDFDDTENRLVCVGDDFGRVHLFRYPVVAKRPTVKRYQGHSSHVTNVRFSTDDQFVFTTGGQDMSLFQWKVRGNK